MSNKTKMIFENFVFDHESKLSLRIEKMNSDNQFIHEIFIIRKKTSFESSFEIESKLYESDFSLSIENRLYESDFFSSIIAQMHHYNENSHLIKMNQKRFQFSKVLIDIYVIAFSSINNILQCEFICRFKIISMIFMNQSQKIQTQMSKTQIRNHSFSKIILFFDVTSTTLHYQYSQYDFQIIIIEQKNMISH